MRRRPAARGAGPRRVPTLLAGLLVLALLLAGCAAGGGSDGGGSGGGGSGGGGSGGGGSATSQGSGETETFDSPEPEPTTPESSDEPTGSDDPSITVARLPIGGGSQDDESDPRLQCAQVTWIADQGGQIPSGTGIEISGAIFDPNAFEAVADGCGSERPSCLGYIFRTSALACDLAVRATGAVAQDARPSLGLAGRVFCPDKTSTSCRSFIAALGKQQQISVSLNVPQLPEETTSAPGTTEATETTTDPPTETSDTTTTDGG